MSRPEPDEPYQHGSTVLPGVPLPASAHPHPPEAPPAPPTPPPPSVADAVPVAAPDAVPADGPAPSAEPPADAPPQPPRGRHAAAAAEPAASGGRSRLLLLAIVGLVVVLAAVAAFVWPGFLVSSDDELTGSLGPSPTPSASATVTLATPDTVAGLRRFTGEADKALASSVANASVEGLSDPVSAVYGKGTAPQAQVIAWRAVSPPADDTVTAAFTGYEGSTGAQVTAVREVRTPGLGGQMECGLATLKKVKTLQCFWADDASVGSVTVLSVTDRAKATATASEIRAAVEQTS